MLKNFEQMKEMLRAKPVKRRVAVATAQDEHTLQAVVAAARDGLVTPVLIGQEARIRELLDGMEFDARQAEILNEEDPATCAQIAADLAREGKADCIMKGKLETGTLMKVLVNRERGIRKNDVMSLVAFFESPYYHQRRHPHPGLGRDDLAGPETPAGRAVPGYRPDACKPQTGL